MFNKRLMLIFAVILLILPIFVFAIEWAPLPPHGGNEEPPPGIPQITYNSTLEITEINVKVDGNKGTITNNGEKIREEAKEESDVEFEINVKNIWGKRIEDIDVAVTIKNIDDNDDLDEKDEIKDLEPNDSDKADLDFRLPLKVDGGNYDIKIHVEGRDRDNNLHKTEWELILKVEKEKHKIVITKAELSPSSITCDRAVSLKLNILNLGSEEEDTIRIEIKNEDLGINSKQEDIELGTGTDDDAEYQKMFILNIPQNTEKGAYSINVKVYYDKNKLANKKDVILTIKECVRQKENSIPFKTIQEASQPSTILSQQKEKEQTTITYKYNEPLILLLTIFLIILIGVITLLVGAIVIKLRR